MSDTDFFAESVLRPPFKTTYNFKSSSNTIAADGPSIELKPNEKIFLTFKVDKLSGYSGTLLIEGPSFYREMQVNNLCIARNCVAATSLWHSLPQTQLLKMRLFLTNSNPNSGISYSIRDFSLLRYESDATNFPIDIQSLFPYRAVVNNMPENGFFESNKIFLKNYRVKVNGIEVSYSETPLGRLGVPIGTNKSIIEIETITPFLTKILFATSAALLAFLLIWIFRTNRRWPSASSVSVASPRSVREN
jgi:hypothetical protein